MADLGGPSPEPGVVSLPPLKDFDAPGAPETPLDRLRRGVLEFPGALAGAASGLDVITFVAMMTDSVYAAKFTVGFVSGLAAGSRVHIRSWLNDLARVIDALSVQVSDLDDVTVVGTAEMFV